MPNQSESTRACAPRLFVKGLLLGCVLAVGAGSATAANPNGATSSRAAREDAMRSIPLDKLNAEDRAKVSATVTDASLYRRLPTQVIQSDPDLYLFLVKNPEVVVNIWEVLKISNVQLARTGADTFRANDGAGTLSDVKYCYSDHETQVIYTESTYNGPLINRPVRAKCVLLLKSGYARETDGHYYVTSRMDTFIQIENIGVELLAKTLQLLVLRSADYNFVETARYAGMISQAAEQNSPGVYRLAGRLENLQPEVRQQFANLVLQTGQRARGPRTVQASATLPAGRPVERSVSETR